MLCPLYSLEEELEEAKEAAVTARAEVLWDEASTDGGESEELEITKGEDNVELLCYDWRCRTTN